MANLSVALASARTYLNDDNASLWSDAMLIPKAQEAHRELQVKLWLAGSPLVREESSAISVASGTGTSMSSGTYPSDLLAPTKLFEYAATVETIADAVEMTETDFLPHVAIGTTLKYWSWRKQVIQFVGCSATRKVVIQYRRSITIPAASGDDIAILFGELYIGVRAAAIAAKSVGNQEDYDTFTQISNSNLELIIAGQRGQQKSGRKP